MKPQVKLQRIVFLLTNDFRFDSRVRKLAQAAAKFDYESHVVCYISDETKTQKYFNEKGVQVHRVGEVFLGLDKEPLWKNILWFFPYIFLYGNPKNNKYLYKKALEIKPHIIWANDASTLLIGVKLKRKLRAKLIYDAHELWSEFLHVYHKNFSGFTFKVYALFYSWVIALIERLLIKQANKIVTVNSSLAQILQTQYQLMNKPQVITNAYPYVNNVRINKQEFKIKYKIPLNSRVLAYSGYIGAGRAVNLMLNTLNHLSNKYYLFALIPDHRISRFKKLANDLGVANRVIAQPFVKYNQIVLLLANCDLGLLLLEKNSNNLIYALPNKFFEYIQSGLPIVSGPHTQVVNEFIKKQQIGIVTNSLDPQIISQNIQQLFSTPERYKYLRNNVLKIRQKLSWQNEEKKMKNLLSKIT